MKKLLIALSLLLFLINNCVIIKELIPQKPSPSLHPDNIIPADKSKSLLDEDIASEYFFIKGYNEPHTPPNINPTENLKEFLNETQGSINLNRSGIIAYYNPNTSQNKIKSIIILIPGIYSGGATVTNLAKSIKKRIKGSDVWVWERRANLLEDRRPIIKAIKENNPQILTNLLEKDKLKLKKDSFYQPSTEDISFVGYWGIDVALEDLLNVVQEAKKRADEVILCGYSLGVLYATLFLANDFDPTDKVKAGYEFVDKVMLLDGPPMINAYVKDEKTYKEGATLIPYNVIEGKDKLESGKYYPCNVSVTRDMSEMFLVDLRSALALMAPDDMYPYPYNANGKKLPITNLAAFLTSFDDNYLFFKLFTGTFGRADAKHIGKFNYNSTVKIVGLSEGEDKINWIPRKKDDKVEFNDYKEYLKAACEINYNMAEWYQPTRILIDIGSINQNDTSTGWQSKYFNITQTKNIDRPFLCVGLSRGLSSRMEIYLKYKEKISSKDFTILMINSITHLDGDTINDNGGRPLLADVVTHWLNGDEIVYKDSPNIKEAFYK